MRIQFFTVKSILQRCLFCICVLTMLAETKSQSKEGTVYYLKIINQHRTQIPGQLIMKNIPEFRVENFILSFKDSISVYGKLGEGKQLLPVMGLKQSDIYDVYYKNIFSKEFKAFKIFRSAKYLVSDKIEPQKWKLGKETKVILGHTCYKATRVVSRNLSDKGTKPVEVKNKLPDLLIEAWYSSHIKVPVGPDSFDQLPGLILEVNVDGGAVMYTATKVHTETNPLILVQPQIGKVISNQAYMNLLLQSTRKTKK